METLLRKTQSLLYLVTMTYRTRSLAFARLTMHARRAPRHQSGTFRFSFGPVRYVDLLSLTWQYPEIFVDEIYDVEGLGDAPVIVDCGGNIGLSVIWFKRRYPRANITVYEADPAIVSILRANIAAFRLRGVDVVHAAVGAQDSTVTFAPDGADGGAVAADGPTMVPAVRLVDRLPERVDLLKVDIEGSEYDLVADLCASTSIERVQHIIFEIHGNATIQGRVSALWEQLTEAGFRLGIRLAQTVGEGRTPFPSVRADFLLHVYAWRP